MTVAPLGHNTTVSYTGGVVAYSIPADGTVTAYVWGAAGRSIGDISGGGGGYITGIFDVSSGQNIYLTVGGAGGVNNAYDGGYNRGGNADTTGVGGGGGGGGASYVCYGASDAYYLIAGGGGGADFVQGNGGGGGDITTGGGNGGSNGVVNGVGGATGTYDLSGGEVTVSGTTAGGGGGGGNAGTAAAGGGGGGGASYAGMAVTGVSSLVPTDNGTSSGAAAPHYVAGVGVASTTGTGNGRIYLVYTPTIACFLKGSLIQTPAGPVPIETVSKNSYVNNQYGEAVEVIYTVSQVIKYADYPDIMYKIPKDSLGNTSDLFITKQHPFFINGVRKEARDLDFSVASKEEVVDENGNITVYNISIVDGNVKNLIMVNGACEIGSGE